MLRTRTMELRDISACANMLNLIVEQGGTTAHEEPYSDAEFESYYFDKPAISNVALSGDRVVGFQALFDRGDGVYSIGSFTDQENPVKGAGRALMEKTIADCRMAGGTEIIASITADNKSGLGFYDKMGFVDADYRKNDHQRRNGIVVDRVVKKLDLGGS